MNTDEVKIQKCYLGIKWFSFIGFLLVLTAVCTYLFSDAMIKTKINQNLILAKDSKAFNYWQNPPAKIIRKYYLFSIKNPVEVEQGIDKPQLEEKGPYAYSEKWERRNINFIDNKQISFTPVITLQFESSLSNGTENDLINFLNIPAMGMIENTLKSNNIIEMMLTNELFKVLKTKLFISKTVKELISGYADPLMSMAHILSPNKVKDDKFSLLNGKNGTEWQNFTINTGLNDILRLGKISKWNNIYKLDYWDSDTANMINGTDGTMFSPFRSKDQIIYSFSSDICRSYRLEYLKENKINGIKTYDFHLPTNVFSNSTLNPENIGFCGKHNKCLGNGVLNISKCIGGISTFISQPHFLNADSKFRDNLNGLKPDQSLHDFILSFEPTSGVPLRGNIRFQCNSYIFQSSKIDLVKNLKSNLLLPIVWFDDSLELFQNNLNELAQLALIVQLCSVIPLSILCLGSLCILISLYIYIHIKFKVKQTKQHLKDDSVEVDDENTKLLK